MKLHRKKERQRRKMLKLAKRELKESEAHQALLRELHKIELESQRQIAKAMEKLTTLQAPSKQDPPPIQESRLIGS